MARKSNPSMTIEQRIRADTNRIANPVLGNKLMDYIEQSAEYDLQDTVSDRTWAHVLRDSTFTYNRGEDRFHIETDLRRLSSEFAVLDATRIRKELVKIPGVGTRRYSYADHVNGRYVSAHHISVDGTDVAHMVDMILPANHITINRDFPERERYVQRFIEVIGETDEGMVHDQDHGVAYGEWRPLIKNRKTTEQYSNWIAGQPSKEGL